MQRYRTENPLISQQAEDLVARHVLKGMGLTEKAFYMCEGSLLGDRHPDDALWVRVYRLYQYLMSSRSPILVPYKIDVRVSKSNHSDIIDLMLDNDDMPSAYIYPAIMTRVNKSKKSLTYALYQADKLNLLEPPILVVARMQNSSTLLIAQDTTHFVKQFGPYRQVERLGE